MSQPRIINALFELSRAREIVGDMEDRLAITVSPRLYAALWKEMIPLSRNPAEARRGGAPDQMQVGNITVHRAVRHPR